MGEGGVQPHRLGGSEWVEVGLSPIDWGSEWVRVRLSPIGWGGSEWVKVRLSSIGWGPLNGLRWGSAP